ncbi:type II toxin-antitoxin system VapC family toxin [Myxosarcina sp. GI1(2024)]
MPDSIHKLLIKKAKSSGCRRRHLLRKEYHKLAASIYRKARDQGDKLITTNYVLSELFALFISPLNIPRYKAIAFIDSVKNRPMLKSFIINIKMDFEAWQLLSQRQDKNWSLVDCSGFVIMNHRQVTEALTTDRHFEQAGFVRLLKN